MTLRSAFRVPSLALLEALLTTAIWGSSFVVAKVGLRSIGPITLAGLRYSLAFLLLLPFLFHRVRANGWPSPALLRRLALLGIAAYLVGNGSFFFALQVVPSTTVSFMMGLIPILIVAGSVLWLKENPRGQAFGLVSPSRHGAVLLPGCAQVWRGINPRAEDSPSGSSGCSAGCWSVSGRWTP
jgi:drug/metabolite transporter (DMT)-like permease